MAISTLATQGARIGLRIKAAREQAGLTQEMICRSLGFKDRQTLAAIEAGTRKVSATELVAFMHTLERDLDFFTDPFRLVGEGRFSFRAKGSEPEGLDVLEENAGRWIAFWREQGRRQQEESNPLRQRLELNSRSDYLDAARAGEQVWKRWNLGEVPAERLEEVASREINLLVLHVDMPAGIHGAACQATDIDTVLVNRRDSEGRRHFDLAHEIFHVLTWDALPPQRVDREAPTGSKDKRTEHMADNFAGALLMPEPLLEPLWRKRDPRMPLSDWMVATARRFRVSGQALKWRLYNLKWISQTELESVGDASLVDSGAKPPPRFSRRFMERAARAIDRGDVSVMRLSKLLATTGIGDLEKLFQEHGLAVPFDM